MKFDLCQKLRKLIHETGDGKIIYKAGNKVIFFMHLFMQIFNYFDAL